MGENGAGKTTLMRVAAGFYEPDAGRVEIRGQPVRLRRPEHALERGVGMVHQHFTLVPTLSAAENIALRPSAFPRRARLDDVTRRALVIAGQLGFDFEPDKLVKDLTLAERQRLEIIKLIDRGADILIFDEPSASLPPSEWGNLAALITRLAEGGKSVIVITHRIDEVLGIAQTFTVMRDGAVTGRGRMADVDQDQLVKFMVGRSVKLRPDRLRVPAGPPVLSVRELSVRSGDLDASERLALQGVSFDVHEGEIVGVAGVGGKAQQALVDTLIGVRQSSAGSITLAGRPFDRRTPREFARLGGAYIPEDRHTAAIADELAVWENLLMREITTRPFSRHSILRTRAARARAAELVEQFDIRTPGVTAKLRQLSGGNQQKVVVARELGAQPRFMIAHQPTRGLDVGATEFVYKRLNDLKREGGSVLLISLDLEELLSLSDRIVVLTSGRVQGVIDAATADAEAVGLLMTGDRGP
jgi:simple sugar transport system ATP-binding protein